MHGVPWARSINMSLGGEADNVPAALRNFGLMGTGSVNTTVARFSSGATNIGTRPLSEWVTQTTTSQLGSSFKIILAGKYAVATYYRIGAAEGIGGAGTVEVAGTLDAEALSSNPDPDAEGTLGHTLVALSGDGDTFAGCVTGVAIVTAAMAADPVLGTIRYQASDGAGAAPGDTLALLASGIRIWRVGDSD